MGGMDVSECHKRLFLTLPCVEDVDITLPFAYLEPDQLLRMPHSVQKVQWYKVYGKMITWVAFQFLGD